MNHPWSLGQHTKQKNLTKRSRKNASHYGLDDPTVCVGCLGLEAGTIHQQLNGDAT